MNEKILIVDDGPDILQTLEALLTSEGFQVRKASGGQQAIEICQSEPPDLVITDIRIPGMDVAIKFNGTSALCSMNLICECGV